MVSIRAMAVWKWVERLFSLHQEWEYVSCLVLTGIRREKWTGSMELQQVESWSICLELSTRYRWRSHSWLSNRWTRWCKFVFWVQRIHSPIFVSLRHLKRSVERRVRWFGPLTTVCETITWISTHHCISMKIMIAMIYLIWSLFTEVIRHESHVCWWLKMTGHFWRTIPSRRQCSAGWWTPSDQQQNWTTVECFHCSRSNGILLFPSTIATIIEWTVYSCWYRRWNTRWWTLCVWCNMLETCLFIASKTRRSNENIHLSFWSV